MSDIIPKTVRVACQAMATRFEIILHGEDEISLRAAGEEALSEIRSLEAQMNLYSPSSELSHINRRAAEGPVKVEPDLFRLLQQARSLHEETGGAFDITVAPLMRCWGFMKDTGRMPVPDELAKARELVGMQWLEFNLEEFTVRFLKEGVTLDLGAIGKGYAIQMAAEILEETGVTNALIHGGTSTSYGLGNGPDGKGWKVAIEFSDDPSWSTPGESTSQNELPQSPPVESKDHLLAVVRLQNQAMSVSAIWGKAFQSENKTLGHVIDPRTGHPTQNAALAAVVLPSAPETDAYATALLVAGQEQQDSYGDMRPGFQSLVAGFHEPAHELWTSARGIRLLAQD